MTCSHGMWFRAAVLVLTVFLLSSTEVLSGNEGETVRSWSIRIGEIDRHLMESEWRKALNKSERLISEMVNRVIRGSAAREYLGNAAVRQAIAFSGTGEIESATWTMQVALQILPSLRDFPLDRYGPEGNELQPVKVRKLGDRLLPDDETTNAESADGGEITPPKMIKGRNPGFPWAKQAGSEFHVIVEVILGKDGVPRYPVIEKSDGEFTAVYAVLDEMREWRFKPGRLDGELVEVLYTLRATFRP